MLLRFCQIAAQRADADEIEPRFPPVADTILPFGLPGADDGDARFLADRRWIPAGGGGRSIDAVLDVRILLG